MNEPGSASPSRGTKRARRRLALLDTMADHVLAAGLGGSPLRALATAAGTSDRMLLYYFSDRSDLLATLLAHIAARMMAMLEAVDPGPGQSAADLLATLWAAVRTPEVRPYMRLFIDLAAAAGRDEEPHRHVAGEIAQGFATWVAARLDGSMTDRPARAVRLLATLDGLFLLHAAGLEAATDAAARAPER